jgi:hypothetical protein
VDLEREPLSGGGAGRDRRERQQIRTAPGADGAEPCGRRRGAAEDDEDREDPRDRRQRPQLTHRR